MEDYDNRLFCNILSQLLSLYLVASVVVDRPAVWRDAVAGRRQRHLHVAHLRVDDARQLGRHGWRSCVSSRSRVTASHKFGLQVRTLYISVRTMVRRYAERALTFAPCHLLTIEPVTLPALHATSVARAAILSSSGKSSARRRASPLWAMQLSLTMSE